MPTVKLSDKPHLPAPKAIIFTHLSFITPDSIANKFGETSKKLREFFQGYYDSRASVGLVYVYIDYFVKEYVKQLSAAGKAELLADQVVSLVNDEEQLKTFILDEREKHNERLRKNGEPACDKPSLAIVGFRDLMKLFQRLRKINPALVSYISSKYGHFTYDSPKFVEAVIRIARSSTPHLAWDPIVRIDADVAPRESALQKLLSAYVEEESNNGFYFFSGGYRRQERQVDWLNDFAVRTLWFAPVGTMPDAKLSDKVVRQVTTFLADFNELGATQFSGPQPSNSTGMQRILSSRDRKGNLKRIKSAPSATVAQVISGAGLIMSPRAIRKLPPFMNFDQNTVWIDDHLKRRLHEAIGHLSRSNTERVAEAYFAQNRYPGGTTEPDIVKAQGYFRRLLRGCMLRRLITNLDGSPTTFSKLVAEVVRQPLTANLGKRSAKLREEWKSIIEERLYEVLNAWKSDDYPNRRHKIWARERLGEGSSFTTEICASVLEDAKEYLELTNRWQTFVGAVDELTPQYCSWLFIHSD